MPEGESKLAAYYRNDFLPRLDQSDGGTPNLPAYLPLDPATRYLQTLYIATNPNPVGKKQNLVGAPDNSRYSQVHRRYHPAFRNIVSRFGYYDMFLINPQGQIGLAPPGRRSWWAMTL